jgi:hypothetical protein
LLVELRSLILEIRVELIPKFHQFTDKQLLPIYVAVSFGIKFVKVTKT